MLIGIARASSPYMFYDMYVMSVFIVGINYVNKKWSETTTDAEQYCKIKYFFVNISLIHIIYY
jgi:hypothetical protein